RVTAMPVREVTHGTAVAPNHVYVIPPNSCMFIVGGVLKLRPREKSPGPHRSIDFFLESLAQDQRALAIGIILSGTANDGTQGLEIIKSEGGITFAQDDSAKYDSMPRSAIAAGCVDFTLSPMDIALELGRISKHPLIAIRRNGAQRPTVGKKLGARADATSSSLDNSDLALSPLSKEIAYKNILLSLRKHRGVDFSLYKPSTIERRITRRMVLNQQSGLEDYKIGRASC